MFRYKYSFSICSNPQGFIAGIKTWKLKVRRASLESFISKYEGMDLSDLDNITELKVID